MAKIVSMSVDNRDNQKQYKMELRRPRFRDLGAVQKAASEAMKEKDALLQNDKLIELMAQFFVEKVEPEVDWTTMNRQEKINWLGALDFPDNIVGVITELMGEGKGSGEPSSPVLKDAQSPNDIKVSYQLPQDTTCSPNDSGGPLKK